MTIRPARQIKPEWRFGPSETCNAALQNVRLFITLSEITYAATECFAAQSAKRPTAQRHAPPTYASIEIKRTAMSNTTANINNDALLDGVSATTIERRARALRAQAMAGFFSRVSSLIGRAVHATQASMERRRMVSELSQLDDRLLADVGLNRETLYADLAGARPAPVAYHGPAITGESLIATPAHRPTPANADFHTGRRAA